MRSDIIRNTAFTFFGMVLPAIAAVLAMPVLVRSLGSERVGLLTFIWAIVGYFSLLDLGLGYSVTKSVSAALAAGRPDRVPSLFWGAVRVQVVVGLVSGLALWISVPAIVRSALSLSPALAAEAVFAFRACAVAWPILIVSSSMTGLLQGSNRFDLVVRIQSPLSVAQYAVPAALCAVTVNLQWLVSAILGARVIGIGASYFFAARVYPGLHAHRAVGRQDSRGHLRFGGWLTLANVVSSLLVYADRFFIGTLLSVQAVAHYAIPMDAALKASAIPNSLSTVLFSTFSYESASKSDQSVEILQASFRGLALLLAVPTTAALVFSGNILNLWLGAEFALASERVLQIIIVGVWANSLTRVPYVFVTSKGRPELVAAVLCVEAPLQILSTIYLATRFGVAGAAVAWAGRLATELFVYLLIGGRLARSPLLTRAIRAAAIPMIVTVAGIAVGLYAQSHVSGGWGRAGLASVLVVAQSAVLVRYGTSELERQTVWGWARAGMRRLAA